MPETIDEPRRVDDDLHLRQTKRFALNSVAPMLRPVSFESWSCVKRAVARDAFEDQYPHPFLLHWANKIEALVFFRTQTLTEERLWTHEPLLRQLQRARVVPVVKGPEHPFPERITLGRAMNNDLVVRDGSISKRHGHFARQENGLHHYVDDRSANGSRLNGDTLPPLEPWVVQSGDMLTVGATTLLYFESGAFYDLG